jgi:hypothetical protein
LEPRSREWINTPINPLFIEGTFVALPSYNKGIFYEVKSGMSKRKINSEVVSKQKKKCLNNQSGIPF